MSPPRWIPYAAATVISLVLAISYFAFPNVETRTVTNRVVVDRYAKFKFLEEESYLLKPDGLAAHCITSESRVGVRNDPQDGDQIVQVCTASRGPVG